MTKEIHIDARWDDEVRVWIATSENAPGLVVEASSWQTIIDEVRIVLPDLLEIDSAARRIIDIQGRNASRSRGGVMWSRFALI